MKTRFALVLSLSLGLFSAGAAQASDAALGAIVGGGLGALIASDGDHRHRGGAYHYDYAPPPVRVYTPAPVYAPVYVPVRVYTPAPVVYPAHRVVVHRPPPPPAVHRRVDDHSRHDRYRR